MRPLRVSYHRSQTSRSSAIKSRSAAFLVKTVGAWSRGRATHDVQGSDRGYDNDFHLLTNQPPADYMKTQLTPETSIFSKARWTTAAWRVKSAVNVWWVEFRNHTSSTVLPDSRQKAEPELEDLEIRPHTISNSRNKASHQIQTSWWIREHRRVLPIQGMAILIVPHVSVTQLPLKDSPQETSTIPSVPTWKPPQIIR